LKRLATTTTKKSLVLKSKRDRMGIELYCVLHTPLWVKYQSYLEQHLHASDQDEFEALDAHEQISWSLKTLAQFLNDPRYPTRIVEKDLLDFSVFCADDDNFFKSISKFPTQERSLALSQIKSSGVAVLIQRRYLYISEVTINSCAQVAGLYLYLMWSHTRFTKSDFFKRTLAEALGFFMSKLLNHSRRATPWRKWALLKKTSQKKREAAAVLQSQSFVSKLDNRSHWTKKLSPFEDQSAVALGRNLADAAFEAFLTGEFSQPRLIRLMKTPVKDEREAYQILVELKSVSAAFAGSESKNW
jgi:hypothetical protein